MSFESPWEDIGNALDTQYSKDFLYHANAPGDNPLEECVPRMEDMETFFGVNVLNIFIVQKAYGWKKCNDIDSQREFDWPPEGYEEMKAKFIENEHRFSSYKTLVWVDFWTPTQSVSYFPDSDYILMMESTDAKIQEMCAEVPGFQYMGRISSQVEASFFQEHIDAFFAKNPVRKT